MNKDNKKYIVETLFLKECIKNNVDINEFLLLMYFDNAYDSLFDVKKISKALNLDEKIVLSSFGSLLDKKIITLSSVKNENGKYTDKVSLDNLYNNIKNNASDKETNEKKGSLFTKFQEVYGKALSGMDYDIINAWLASGYSEELILGALNEAVYNGVVSIRYIDKILYEWHKKGFTNMDDVTNHLKKRSEENHNKLYETSVLEYNWLDEE